MKLHEGGTLEGPGAPLSGVGTWSAGCQRLGESMQSAMVALAQGFSALAESVGVVWLTAFCPYCRLTYATHGTHPLTGRLEPIPQRCACPPDWARNRAERQNLGRQGVWRTLDGRIWGPGARWKPLDRTPR